LRFEDGDEALTHERLIIGDDDADHVTPP
jgi:hypothetical protein